MYIRLFVVVTALLLMLFVMVVLFMGVAVVNNLYTIVCCYDGVVADALLQFFTAYPVSVVVFVLH